MKNLFIFSILLSVFCFGCSSDNATDDDNNKIENPVDTYMDYNKNVMSKPQQVQDEMDKIMQQRQDQLKQAEEQYK